MSKKNKQQEDFKFEIVFEDNNLLIVNKPIGISCLDDKQNKQICLLDLAQKHMEEIGEYDLTLKQVPYLCHRIDHNTGGLVIFAKNELAYNEVCSSIAARRIAKYYFSAVAGRITPVENRLSAYLVKDEKSSLVKIYDKPKKNAKSILTDYRVLTQDDDLSLLEVRIHTGRTHQIRAHMAHIGFPVLGDDKYGLRRANKFFKVKYQVLWANRLVLNFDPKSILAYLNGKEIKTKNMLLPSCVRDMLLSAGLFEYIYE